MTGSYTAVTFDFWNTICVPDDVGVRELRRQRVLDELTRLGVDLTEEQLDAAFGEMWETFQSAWKANRQFLARDAVRVALDHAGVRLGDAHVDDLTEVFASSTSDRPAPLAENIVRALDALREAGVAVGIVCDVGLTPSRVLRGYLRSHRILDRFDHWSFSDEVGVYKPHRAIFEHALAGLGAPSPERAAHVGDLRRTDVAGARAVGMTAVRYTGVADDAGDGDDAPEAHHVIGDHAELAGALGLG